MTTDRTATPDSLAQREVSSTGPASGAGRGAQSRRSVLCGLAATMLASGALAACGTASGGDAQAPSAKPGTPVAKLSEIPVGGGKLVDLAGGASVLLLRPEATVVHGVDPICPHAGAHLPEPQHGLIVCPLHGSEFDAGTGALKQGPARRGLSPVPVTVTGDEVVLA